MTPITFFAHSDIVVIGVNPEMADLDNPRGEIYGYAAYVYAEDVKGYRTRLWVATEYNDKVALEKAEHLASALRNRLASGSLPVAFYRWEETRPAYGSEAYEEVGHYEYMRECEEDH